MKQEQTELEKKIRAIIFGDEFETLGKIKFKNDESVGEQIRKFKVNAFIDLFAQREAEVKRELRVQIEEKIKKIDAGKDSQGQIFTYVERYSILQNYILSLLAGKGEEECGCEADERGIKHTSKEHFPKGEEK